jgi:hypothetical protein
VVWPILTGLLTVTVTEVATVEGVLGELDESPPQAATDARATTITRRYM